MAKKQKHIDNTDTLQWSIFNESSDINSFHGINFKSIKLDVIPDLKSKIPVICKMPNIEQRILYLPQNIYSYYPVILQDNPKTVIHGKFDRKTGECLYTIIRNIKEPLLTKQSIYSLHIFSISKKIKRLMGHPFKHTGDVFNDIKENVTPKNIFAKPDYKKDQAFLSSLEPDFIKKAKKRYTLLLVISLIATILYICLSQYFYHSVAYISVIPLLLIVFIALYRRYEVKYQKRVKIHKYIWLFLTCRGF